MEKIFKKSLALVLSAALCLTALVGCLTVSAEGTTAKPTYALDAVEGKPGDIVTVTATISNLNKVCAEHIKVTFPAGLAIGDITDGNGGVYTRLTETTDVTDPDLVGLYSKTTTADNGTLIQFVDFVNWPKTDGTYDNVIESLVIKFAATISTEAEAGHVYDITAAVDAADYDADKLMDVDITNGSVTVKAAATEPVEITNKLLAHDLYLSAAVGSRIAVNVNANNGLMSLGYSDYYLVIDYNKYGSGYKDFVSHSDTLLSSQKKGQNAKGTVDYFYFTSLALYEMPLEYTVTIYLKDDTGNTVAYKRETTSVVSQALTYAKKYSNDTTLLTALVDMVNYGDAVQTYFANSNQNSLIATAVSPKIGFEDYQQYASSADVLPAKFNDTKKLVKVLDTTTLQGSSTVIIGASNNIKYTFLANNYDQSKMVAEIEYVDSYGKTQNTTINFADMDRAVSPKNGNVTYSCVYEGLAIYDVEKTVSVKLINDGVHEATYNYSLGKFVNSYIGIAEFTDVLTKMELFSRSARIQLVGE